MNRVDKFDVVEAWLNNVAYSHSGSKKTNMNYKFFLNRFCKFINKTPQQIVDEYDQIDEKSFKRKYGQYLKAYISELVQKQFAPNTINSHVSIVKSFFKYSDLPLSFVPCGRIRIIYHNRDLTKTELLKILGIARTRDRAFFVMMVQSGLRPYTLCLLKMKHLEPDFSEGKIPCKIEIPEEIAKGKFGTYFTFISKDAVEYLKDYFRTKPNMTADSYIFTGYGKNVEKKTKRTTFTHIFMRLVDGLRAKGELSFERIKGKPAQLRLYNLRKYFKKMATPAGEEFVEFWMGHKGGVEQHYLSKDVEFHRKRYTEKAAPHLRLESATASETDKVIQELRDQLTERNEKLRTQLMKRDEKIQELEEFRKDTIKQMHELAEMKRSVKHDLEYIRQMRKDLEFYKEGGVSVAYMKNKISKENVKKIIEESKKEHKE